MIIQNAIRDIKNNRIYISKHRHDFVSFRVDDYDCFIDGGLSYHRSGGEIGMLIVANKLEDLDLTDEKPLQEICEKLICEKQNKLWKDLTIEELRDERQKIMDAYNGSAKKDRELWNSYSQFTRHHSMLHFYVSGYWLVRKS